MNIRWLLPFTALIVLILIPFALFGDQIEQSLTALFATGGSKALMAMLAFGLLSLDVVLPLPSSLIAAGTVVVAGAVAGGIIVFAGLMAGNILGFVLGRHIGRPVLAKFSGTEAMPNAGPAQIAVLALTRAVPVLSEAMTVAAGTTQMRFQTFFWTVGAANAGVALVYAIVGHLAVTQASFVAVFAGSVLVPVFGYAVWWASQLIRR